MSRRTLWMTPFLALLLVGAACMAEPTRVPGTRASAAPFPVAREDHARRHDPNQPGHTNLARLPLAFEENCGQAGDDFDFIARGPRFGLGLTPGWAQLVLSGGPHGRSSIRMQLLDASGSSRCMPLDPLPGTVNDLRGPTPASWVRGITTWERVRYADVWPGIDLQYHGTNGTLEYDFIVGPGVDPSVIRLAFSGAESVSLEPSGDLNLSTAAGDIIQRAPVMYQEGMTGRKRVEGHWCLAADGSLSFTIGPYDNTLPLVIDPVIAYTWALGGGGLDEVHAALLDASGNLYFAGETSSVDFPTRPVLEPPYQDTFAGGLTDAFLCQLNEDGSEVLFSTYIGGSGSDAILALALAGDGSVVLAGRTDSADFPTLSSDPLGVPFQEALAGGADGFVATLAADGSTLIQGTYIGGAGDDHLVAVAVDGDGIIYVAGNTVSDDFPTVSAPQPARAGGQDAIASALAADLSSLVYSTYDGTPLADEARAMVLDATGYAAITGYHEDALKGREAYVRRMTTAGGFLTHTSFGGLADDEGNAIAVDLDGNLCIAGTTASTDFPLESPAYHQLWGATDAFMVCIDPDTSSLLFSTYCGGSGDESGQAIAAHGNMVTLLANSDSTAINLGANTPFYWNQGGQDALIVSIDRSDPDVPLIGFATFFGGGGTDSVTALAVDDFGTLHFVGNTNSGNFPSTDSLFGGTSTDSIFAAQIITSPAKHGQIVFHDQYYSTPPDSTKRIRVDRLVGTEGPVSVEYTTVDFIAWHDVHYTSTTGTLDFLEGQTTAYFDVELLPTNDDDLDVVLILRIYDVEGGAMIGEPWEAELRIHNAPPAGGGQVLACPAGVVASGTWLAPTLDDARALRDNRLMPHPFGRALVGAYYATTRPLTEYLIDHKGARFVARFALAPALIGVRYPMMTLALLVLGIAIMGRRLDLALRGPCGPLDITDRNRVRSRRTG